MKFSIELKQMFPSLASNARKAGADADVLSSALFLYLLSMEEGEKKDALVSGLEKSIQELNKILSDGDLTYSSNIDLDRNYIVKPGFEIEEVVSDSIMLAHISEMKKHTESLKKLSASSEEETLRDDDAPLEDFGLSLESEELMTTDEQSFSEEEDSSTNDTEIIKESTSQIEEILEYKEEDEAKLEDILDDEPEALSLFGQDEFFEEEEDMDESGFARDEDYGELSESDIIDLHGEEEPFVSGGDTGDSGSQDINDFRPEKLLPKNGEKLSPFEKKAKKFTESRDES